MYTLTINNLDFTIKNILFPPENIQYLHRKHIFDSLCIYMKKINRL